MNNEIHIGKLIKAKLKENGHSVTWFAKQVACHRTNVYKIFEKQHLSISQLDLISRTLNYDFLSLYAKDNTKEQEKTGR